MSIQDEVERRDFLYIATTAFAAVGTAFAAWPFLAEMLPSADVIAAAAPIAVDLSPIEPGQQITVLWRGHPVFVLRRSEAALAMLKSPALLVQLRDANSSSRQQPAYAQNWSRSVKPDFLVLIGVCTHLGCIPMFMPERGSLNANWPGGYFCPCHGSKYDLAGRVYKNVPAPLNLPVPPYRFQSETTLIIGENPPGQSFSPSDIEQL